MRAVRCIDTKTGKSKKASRCDAKLKPTDRQTCTLKLCGPEPNCEILLIYSLFYLHCLTILEIEAND